MASDSSVSDSSDSSVVVSDGAATIRCIREGSFPGAIELLDRYHLTEDFRHGIDQTYGDVLSDALGAAGPRGARRRDQELARHR